MAKITTIVCDVTNCKREAYELKWFLERRTDGAGGSENWHHRVDLCPEHMQMFIQQLAPQVNKTLIEDVSTDIGFTLREE